MRFLVTGANGFVGKHLCAELLRQGHIVRAAVRSANTPIDNAEVISVGAIDGETNWTDALRDVDVVVHLAARVHVMKDTAANPLAAFLKVNTQGTANLANQAATAGVKRFLYVSSIKVNGEQTTAAHPFVESDIPNPQDAYGISKWQAEQSLQRIAQKTGLEVVIVRPPLVYGPGVKGNFLRLLAAVDRGIPLPLASVRNKRSLIYVGNFTGALLACAIHPAAAGKTYLVRDGQDMSTPELVQQMAAGLGRTARLLQLNTGVFRLMGRLLGKTDAIERITGSLCVDDHLIRSELGWQPKFTVQQGLQVTADWFRHDYATSSS
ncbi:MAG: SDR family oxidoreductase [Gallionella sp.]|nr:SDR family oxidoreductase [Gallionella sp.]